MTASRIDIVDWIHAGLAAGATHLIVGHDPFDHENFPVFTSSVQETELRIAELLNTGNRYDEIYHLRSSIDFQLGEWRAHHKEPIPDKPLEEKYQKMLPSSED
jgi:hypothetical protein